MLETLVQNGPAVDAPAPLTTVSFNTSHGPRVSAPVVRLNPQCVTFEISAPETFLRLSELLTEFEVLSGPHTVFNGKAIVTSLLHTGTALACEVALSSPLFELDSLQFHDPAHICGAGFNSFLQHWQQYYRVHHDYKVAVADIESFLASLRLWLEQVELSFQSAPAPDRRRLAEDVLHGIQKKVTSALAAMFERLEVVANSVEPHLQPAHRSFGQRHLHPHLLCAPFVYRTYAKPLGFAGDYEMMNMILRDSLEGNSLYAKLVNAWLLDQAPAHAVRNRVKFLSDRITEETLRVARLGRRAAIYSVACGPAREVENFIAGCEFADNAEFRLLDFNQETLHYTGARLTQAKRENRRNTQVTTVKNSVQSLLKASGRSHPDEPRYDLIYCSGLYDYLNDRLIKALNTYLYDLLAPGGLLVVGNFATNNPIQKIMEHALEWFLLYRSTKDLLTLSPSQAHPDDCVIKAEPSATHFFLEVRKPE
jgi:extracellular factor (EF) 3-hydroxypalmitic acid methyl ester biosynthesis protein